MSTRAALAAELLRAGGVLPAASSRPAHFGDPARELGAALDRCALADRSDLDRLTGTGPDLLDLLHRLSTQDLRSLAPGRGAATVLTTPKGRIVERLFVHHLGPRGILLVAGRGGGARTSEHLRRYTFRERIELREVSDTTCQLALIGPLARRAAARAGLPVPDGFGATPAPARGGEASVVGEDGFSGEGLSVVAPLDLAAALWRPLLDAVLEEGGTPIGDEALEAWRVLRGHPAPGRELTEEHNPLEAGLSDAVSFTKGCYVGQEVVARLRTYDKVSREILALVLPEGEAAPPPGSCVRSGGLEVGSVTSAVVPPGGRRPVALAYVKKRDVPEDGSGVTVLVSGREVAAEVRRPPLPGVP